MTHSRSIPVPQETTPAPRAPGAPGYYGHARPEVVSLVPPDARRILDIGCAAGLLGQGIKARQDCHVTGIEINPAAAAEAAARLDLVLCGDAAMWLDQLPPDSFDAIIMADVIEHLADTAGILARVRSRLKAGGVLVASVPNVRHWSVIRQLLEGEWRYTEAGILDRTHLRFFTRRSFLRCLREAGFAPPGVRAVMLNGMEVPAKLPALMEALGLDAGDLAAEAGHYQYLFVAARPA